MASRRFLELKCVFGWLVATTQRESDRGPRVRRYGTDIHCDQTGSSWRLPLSSEVSGRRTQTAQPAAAVDEILGNDVRHAFLVLQPPTDLEQAGLQEWLTVLL